MVPAPLVFLDVPLNGSEAPTVTLEIPAHRAVSVVGGENSGVHLMGRLALGLITPKAGHLTVLGRELATLPRQELLAYRRLVGYLPAGDGLLQNLTLGQNVALPLSFGSDFSEGEIESRLNIMLAAAGLANAGHLRPAQANDEQRRRAALARVGFRSQTRGSGGPFRRSHRPCVTRHLGNGPWRRDRRRVTPSSIRRWPQSTCQRDPQI